MVWPIGTKVECIDVGPIKHPLAPIEPAYALEKGAIYTVVGSFSDYRGDFIGLSGVRDGRAGWLASRFRPVVERQYDISIFKAMLNPSDERETV